jgi:hypothetical protein
VNAEASTFETWWDRFERLRLDGTAAIELGICPIIVTDATTAAQAGEWAQDETTKAISNAPRNPG